MTIEKFNNLTDREKWDALWSGGALLLGGTWHCKHCGEELENEMPYRAQPFSGASVCCGDCDGELTRRTGGGQNDPFNWILKEKK